MIPKFEYLTTEILKARLYDMIETRRIREINSDVELTWFNPIPEGLNQAFKENNETDKEIRERYGKVKFI